MISLIAALLLQDLIELREQHVQITIKETMATKVIKSTFHNNAKRVMEDDFLMHIEPDVSIDSFKVKIDGKEQIGELLDAEKAKKIYESIVQQRKDPALLEYYGYQLLRVRVFPIQPDSDYQVEVTLNEALKTQNGVARVTTLNNISKGPIRSVSCVADLESTRPLKMIFSPTHDINVQRATDRKARVTYEKKEYVALSPLTFYFSTSDEDIGATLLTFRQAGEDSTFMLTLNPKWEIKDSERLPRDVVFAIDISGSMANDGKMAQVREALKKCVQTLRPADRFNIITYSTEAGEWKEKLVAADAEARAAAVTFAEGLRPHGGTAIEEALKKSLAQFDGGDTVKILVFLTDGLPTIGEIDTAKLLLKAKEMNKAGARIFAFGVGDDLNTQLLDALAVQHGGDREYVRPNEDAAFALAAFAGRMDSPLLASPKVKFEGVEITEIYPRTLPDVFRGGQLLVLGRFKGEGKRKLELSGKFLGRDRVATYEVDFSGAMTHDFIPKLWAIKKIDFLLDQVRLNGKQKELLDEIVALAKKYAIVTPYTSYLIIEDKPTSAAPAEFEKSVAKGYNGKEEVDKSRNAQDWRRAENNEAQNKACQDALAASTPGAERALERRLRQVCENSFYNEKGIWVDARISDKEKYEEIEVAFNSDAYWKMVREDPSLARNFALGQQVRCLNQKKQIVNVR